MKTVSIPRSNYTNQYTNLVRVLINKVISKLSFTLFKSEFLSRIKDLSILEAEL